MHGKIAAVILLSAGFVLVASGCGSANRAIVEQEDMAKVFPWPNNKESVTIRVKPMTLWVNTCTMLGSFEEVQVTPDTTFYVVDGMDKKFAYTPSRSPIRRLAKLQSMEIRWPQEGAKEDVDQEVDAPENKDGKSTDKAGKPNEAKPAPAPAKKGQNIPAESSGE